jgi:hypothetical protein
LHKTQNSYAPLGESGQCRNNPVTALYLTERKLSPTSQIPLSTAKDKVVSRIGSS